MEGVSMAFNQRNGDLACLSIKNMISFDLTWFNCQTILPDSCFTGKIRVLLTDIYV
jgi:hypothetical protein